MRSSLGQSRWYFTLGLAVLDEELTGRYALGWMEPAMPPNLFTDFGVNFFANLGGALFGVLLAFLIERHLARHESKKLYGRILQSCHFELGYRPEISWNEA
jgi:hypothetical protein